MALLKVGQIKVGQISSVSNTNYDTCLITLCPIKRNVRKYE